MLASLQHIETRAQNFILIFILILATFHSYSYFDRASRARGVGSRQSRALSRVASGSRPAPETPLKQRAVERALCSDQSGHARGRITRGEALICTTDECHGAKSAAL